MTKEGEILVLNQMIDYLEETFRHLQRAFENKNPKEFNFYKRNLLYVQRKIAENLK